MNNVFENIRQDKSYVVLGEDDSPEFVIEGGYGFEERFLAALSEEMDLVDAHIEDADEDFASEGVGTVHVIAGKKELSLVLVANNIY